jgi:hypothetical protein
MVPTLLILLRHSTPLVLPPTNNVAPVYKQKVYNFDDVAVGYEFVHTLYRGGRDGSLKVDLNLINDVVEQKGGGGEPLNVTAR